MPQYAEPYILFLLGIVICNYTFADTTSFIFCFFAIASISLMILARHPRENTVICVVSVILAILYPAYMAFLPAIGYTTIFHRKYRQGICYLIPPVIAAASHLYGDILAWCLPACLSVYMAHCASVRNDLTSRVIRLRDTAAEHEQNLREQNLRLVETQNDQIYIATLQERNRIAREIHDNVGHMLSSAFLQVGALITVTGAKEADDDILRLLSTLKDTLDKAMDNIRSSVHDLHDEAVDLKQALSSLCEQFTFCPVTLQCETGRYLPRDVKYCFITITKEAFSNIMKHSNATKANVTVREHPGFYQLLIEDNGSPASANSQDAVPAQGIGLSNMQERVNLLNGVLHIQTEKGFRIFISIPKRQA